MGSETWPWKLWSVLVCILVLLMVDSTQAGRQLQEQQRSKQIRLLAYTDSNCTDPRHAPPVQSFLVSDGSWVDCIPIEGQIAAHHPSLKDHIIRMAPSRGASTKRHPQLFAQEHGGCPEGSIPVLRDDPNRKFMKKTATPVFRRSSGGDVSAESIDPDASTATHQYAITGIPNASHAYSGAHSIFSVNAPTLGSESDMSLSQIWIVDGSYSDNSLSTIEVGWQTQPGLHPDDDPDAPHLFIFWTNDAYATTGPGSCYNLLCAGFVQQSNTWVLGGVMPNYTTLAENAQFEYEVEIEVLYNPSDTNWWLYLNNEPIGYWPSSLYVNGYMQGTANQVQWGGEVAFTVESGDVAHSTTTMGSGAFPSESYPVAAYQRNITYADATGSFVDPGPTVLQDDISYNNPLCYDIQVQLGSFTDWGTYFFFGGSGGNNPGCTN